MIRCHPRTKRSLGLTADPLAIALLLLVLLLLTPLLAGVQVLLVEVLQHLVVGVLWSGIHDTWQDLGEDCQLLRSEFATLGHGHLEFDDEVALLFLVLVEGHTEAPHYLPVMIAHYLSGSGVDGVLLAVQV